MRRHDSRRNMPAESSASQSQRSQELRKFFAPFEPLVPAAEADEAGYNASLLDDGALDAYAEGVLWRLGVKRAMVSLIDRETQYFLAGVVRHDETPEIDRHWFGCSNVPTPGGLCENTTALKTLPNKYICFVVPDLQKDHRFCRLPVVDGSVAKFRFYAGVPITTKHGVNIGSYFVFDEEPRPDGLTLEHRKYLCQSASNVMRHLEIKREAAERRRGALMSSGIARFLDSNLHDPDLASETSKSPRSQPTDPEEADNSSRPESDEAQNKLHTDGPKTKRDVNDDDQSRQSTVPDQVKSTLKRAADILCDSLELDFGGTVVFDVAAGATDAYFEENDEDIEATSENTNEHESKEPRLEVSANSSESPGELPQVDQYQGQVRRFEDHQEAAGVLASSIGQKIERATAFGSLNRRSLQSLVKYYPNGNVWYIDDGGYFSSLEQTEQSRKYNAEAIFIGRKKHSRSSSSIKYKRQVAEAKLLSRIFDGARQIIFIPLWDAARRRWFSGCFAWSQRTMPVFTVESDIAFLAAFSNSVMAEISRLDAIAADQMKADFISSISHEFRSPLHAIITSAEFLRETNHSEESAGLVSTIHNSSHTLLDTINHVLDFSKINSFEKPSNQNRPSSREGLPNELYAITNIALLCEEIVDGMMAAKSFRDHPGSNPEWPSTSVTSSNGTTSSKSPNPESDPVEMILDFEDQDWKFVTQPGALRRIIMNLLGNAQKYTESGFIRVALRAQDALHPAPEECENQAGHKAVVTITVQDTGRGMSEEFLRRSLYTPFAQEDTFASGVGLGLSIVRSIVSQLGGKIEIRSSAGQGTKVQVVLPLDNELSSDQIQRFSPESRDYLSAFEEAERCLAAVRKLAHGKVIALRRIAEADLNDTGDDRSMLDCIEQYLTRWMGFTLTTFNDWDAVTNADLIIAAEQDQLRSQIDASSRGKLAPILLICQSGSPFEAQRRRLHSDIAGFVPSPVGPYKFAKFLLSYFRKPRTEDKLADQVSGNMTMALRSAEINGSAMAPATSNGASVTVSGLTSTEFGQIKSSNDVRSSADIRKEPVQEQADHRTISNRSFSADIPKPKSPVLGNLLSSKSYPPAGTAPSGPLTPNDPRLHILAVDDNEINLQLLERYLAKRKHDTTSSARNGVEAVAAFRDASTKRPYDVILMDLSMPGMDGFEATRQIRQFEADLLHRRRRRNSRSTLGSQDQIQHYHRAYIVALTGLASQRDRDEANDSGFDDYLIKPISFQKVGKLLKQRSMAGFAKEQSP